MSPKLATAQLQTVLQPCFSKMAAENHRSGQVSLSHFSCAKKLLMKLEVNQCYHAFQEDFVICQFGVNFKIMFLVVQYQDQKRNSLFCK